MARLVAFLRGINLGNRRLTMDELRDAFAGLGLEDVDTYAASGNVIFRDPEGAPDELVDPIENHLEETLGYPVRTLLRTLPALERVFADGAPNAAEEENGFRAHAVFLRHEADGDVMSALADLEGLDDCFGAVGRQVVWLRRGGLKESPFSMRELTKALGEQDHTMRTLNTVERIVAKFG
ncbi:MAG: DUF1697 domain-containing protein [Gemmatimonadota bacterium]